MQPRDNNKTCSGQRRNCGCRVRERAPGPDFRAFWLSLPPLRLKNGGGTAGSRRTPESVTFEMPRLSVPPRPTPAPRRKRAAEDDTESTENISQQTAQSGAKSQKTTAHTKSVSRVGAEPGVVKSVTMINFKNHSHTVQVAQPPSSPPSPPLAAGPATLQPLTALLPPSGVWPARQHHHGPEWFGQVRHPRGNLRSTCVSARPVPPCVRLAARRSRSLPRRSPERHPPCAQWAATPTRTRTRLAGASPRRASSRRANSGRGSAPRVRDVSGVTPLAGGLGDWSLGSGRRHAPREGAPAPCGSQ